MPTDIDIARLDQYRAELRQAIQAGVYGHKASIADGIDQSFAFQGCVEMLCRSTAENAKGNAVAALQHLAGLTSEAMIMLALGDAIDAVPGLTPEERVSMSDEAVRRQTASLDHEYDFSNTTVTKMMELYNTSNFRHSGPKQGWDLLRAYVSEEARTMASEGVGHDVVVERLAGFVAGALMFAAQAADGS